MRIAHLTSVHSWTDTRIYQRECRSLVQAGYDVYLVATGVHTHTTDTGVHVIGVTRSRSRVQRMTATIYNVWQAARRLQADVYHIHDPELLPVAWLLKAAGSLVVYDIHEDYSATIASKAWLPAFGRAIASHGYMALERQSLRRLDAAVCAFPAIVSRTGASSGRVGLVQNFPRASPAADAPSRIGTTGRRICYVGIITQSRGILEILDALVEIARDSPSGPAELQLMGRFIPASLEEKCRRHEGWKHVQFHGWGTQAEAHGVMAESNAGIVLLHSAPNHMHAQPNKLFEYMSVGLPIVAADLPAIRQIVMESGCGVVVDSESAHEVAKGIEELLRDPSHASALGEAGRRAVSDRFNWEREETALLALYRELADIVASGRRPRRPVVRRATADQRP